MRYTFETEHLTLRPYGPEDWPHVHRLWSDPAIIWWRADDPMSEDETRDLHGRYCGLNGAAMSGYGWWLVFERGAGELIGQACLKPLPERPGETEIGWQTVLGHRGQGYATEAARGLLRHGFAAMGLQQILATIAVSNAASIALAQGLGMTKIDALTKAGLPHHLFRIGREEWEALE